MVMALPDLPRGAFVGRGDGKGAGYQPSIRVKKKQTILLDFTCKNGQNAAGPSGCCPLPGQVRKEEASQYKSGDLVLRCSACLVDPKQLIPPPPRVHTTSRAVCFEIFKQLTLPGAGSRQPGEEANPNLSKLADARCH